MNLFPILLPLFLLSSLVTAQQGSKCRCCNLGRIYAPYLKSLPAPKKRTNIGNSHIKITTSSKAAQEWFDQGLNLLHSFWEFEAYRCFLQAAKKDPNCAMAYWGICMSLPGKNAESSQQRQLALQAAKSLLTDPKFKFSEHEKLYIDMIDNLIHRGSNATLPKLQEIIKKYPDDVDAIAFLALWIRDGYDQKSTPRPGTIKAMKLLKDALKKRPHHTGLNHYLIHALEHGPDYEQARSAAIDLPKSAPGSGHLVHMPGHVYYLAGEYESTCQAFRDCYRVETAYLKSEGIPPIDNKNYLHNLHFMTYAASDQGRYEEALKFATLFANIKAPVLRNKAVGTQQLYYLANTSVALVHIRARHFDLAAAALSPDSVPPTSSARHFIRFLRSYCLIRHAITHPDEPTSEKVIKQEKSALIQHLKSLKAAKANRSYEEQNWQQSITTCNILLSETRAWLANQNPNQPFKKTWASLAIRDSDRVGYAEPPLLITPTSESLGWLALHAGHYPQAREYFEKSLTIRRLSGHSYLGIARSHRKENNLLKSVNFYQKFLTAFSHADPNLAELKEARDFVSKNKP